MKKKEEKTPKCAEQILVENLLSGVMYPISWRYIIHMTVNAQISSVRRFLHKIIMKRINYVNTRGYYIFSDNVIMRDYSGPPFFRDSYQEQTVEKRSALRESLIRIQRQPNPDYLVSATAQAQNLLFWNAIQNLKRDSRVNDGKKRHYKARAMLHIALDEWTHARALAMKSGDAELISILNFSFGDFTFCCKHFTTLLTALLSKASCSIVIVSKYELCHILTLSLLCAAPLAFFDTRQVRTFVAILEARGLHDLADAIKNFATQNFAKARAVLDTLDLIATLSIYICFAYDSIAAALIKNSVVNAIEAISKDEKQSSDSENNNNINENNNNENENNNKNEDKKPAKKVDTGEIEISAIARRVGCDDDCAESALQRCIFEGLLSGKINYRNMTFTKSDSVNAHRRRVYERNQRSATAMRENEAAWLEAAWRLRNRKEQSEEDLYVFAALRNTA